VAGRELALALALGLGCQAGARDDAQAPGPEPRAVAATLLVEQARRLLADGDPHDAVEPLEQALVLWPDAARAERSTTRRLLVHLCARVGDPERGLALVDEELAESDGDAWLWYARGVALTDLGRHEEALDSFGEACSLDPTHAKARQWRGSVYLLLGRPLAALDELSAALELVRTVELRDIPEGAAEMEHRILLERADAFDALGRHDEARADREAARSRMRGARDGRGTGSSEGRERHALVVGRRRVLGARGAVGAGALGRARRGRGPAA